MRARVCFLRMTEDPWSTEVAIQHPLPGRVSQNAPPRCREFSSREHARRSRSTRTRNRDPRFSCGRDREVAASARCGDSEQQDCGISETVLVPSAVESDTTDSAETADRGATGSEDTLPCAPQPEPEPACTHWHPGPTQHLGAGATIRDSRSVP